MSKTNVENAKEFPFFNPASLCDSPDDVLDDRRLSDAEKRIILSSWASDMYAVESRPWLRKIPGSSRNFRLADILSALRQLDGDDDPPPTGGVPMGARRPHRSVSAPSFDNMMTPAVLTIAWINQTCAWLAIPSLAFLSGIFPSVGFSSTKAA